MKRVVLFLCVLVFSIFSNTNNLLAKEIENNIKDNISNEIEEIKPSYMALRQDECNATVEVTEKTGLEVVNTESFDVNVCKKEIYKVIN